MVLKIIIFTGDNPITANTVAQAVGIQEVIAEVLPEDKAEKVKELQQEGKKLRLLLMELMMCLHWLQPTLVLPLKRGRM